MTEQRKYPRIDQVEGMVARIASGADQDEELIIMHLTKDLSKSGLQFQTDQQLAIDTELNLYIALKSPRDIINHKARVAWVKQVAGEELFDTGVELLDASEEDIVRWDQYISNHVDTEESA